VCCTWNKAVVTLGARSGAVQHAISSSQAYHVYDRGATRRSATDIAAARNLICQDFTYAR
jgi:hypothetical protein